MVVLPLIRNLLNIPVPDFQYVSITAIFAGYPKLNGEFLWKERLNTFDIHTQDLIAEQMAHFLHSLHHINWQPLYKEWVEPLDLKQVYQEEYENAKKRVFPLATIPVRKLIHTAFDNYLSNPLNFIYTPALLHADLSPDHILYDPLQQKLTGIIDFGDMMVGDPAIDIMYLFHFWGEGFLRSFLHYYPHNNTEILLSRIRFFRIAYQSDLLCHAIKHHSANEIKEYLDWFFEYK